MEIILDLYKNKEPMAFTDLVKSCGGSNSVIDVRVLNLKGMHLVEQEGKEIRGKKPS